MKKSMKELESQFEAFFKIGSCEDSEDARIFAECLVNQSEIVLITEADVRYGEIIVHGYHCTTKDWITFTLTEHNDIFVIPEHLNVTVFDVLQIATFDDYRQAIRVICLEAFFSDDSLELPDNISCKVMKSHKVNQPFKSLSIMLKGTNIGISIPFGTMALHMIENNTILDADLVKRIADYSIEELKNSEIISEYQSFDFNDVSKIYGYLINAEINKHLKDYAVCREVADLLLVYRYSLSDSPLGNISAVIPKVHADSQGWSEEFLYEQWLKNTNDASLYEIEPIASVLQEFHDAPDIPYDVSRNLNMYVLTNKLRLNASGVVLQPEVMQNLQGILGKDFYLVPSSLNEFLAFPTDVPIDEVKQMVYEINKFCVSNDEFLSNSVYQYDFDTMELKMI